MKRMLFIGFVFVSIGLLAQISVSNSNPYNSPGYLVTDILLDTDVGTIAGNVVLTNGLPHQIGYFNAVNSNLGMDEGVLLSTGGIGLVVPGGESTQNGINFQEPDLVTAMSQIGMGSLPLGNTIVLEFDFIAGSELVEFEYVFGSKEYTSYTCSEFNDIFGFFLSGPGIQGPFEDNGINIALVPDPDNPGEYTTTPVTINTINSGEATGDYEDSGCDNIDPNWKDYSVFFVPNSSEATVGFPGFTTVLKAQAELICSETYHIKLAIADVSDGVLNSAVFLKKGSFIAGVPLSVGLEDGEEFVICEDSITINPELSGGFGDLNYYWLHNGSQINELEITVGDPGEYTFVVSDECSSLSKTIGVSKYTPVEITIPNYLLLCSDSVVRAIVTGGAPDYITYWTKASVVVTEGVELPLNFGDGGFYTFHIKDGCGKEYSANMEVVSADLLEVEIPGYTYLCEDFIVLEARVSGGYGEVSYYWEFDGQEFDGLSITVYNESPGVATFHVIDDCKQTFEGSVFVETPGEYEDMELTFEYDYLELCQSDKFIPELQLSGGAGHKTYFWYLDGIMITNAVNFSLMGDELTVGRIHSLIVQIVDRCGNEVSHSYRLRGVNCFLPNTFSPNGDGVNDVFVLNLGTYNIGVQFDVFNRWGQYVYRSTQYELCSETPERNCWTGLNMNTGRPCIPGVYYYELQFLDGRKFKGIINLFK